MNILSIETSCDETAAAIIKASRGRIEIVSNIVSSQIEIHKKFGGVVPEVAAREHVRNIGWVIDEALKKAGLSEKNIDLVGVTAGPGLITSLMVGVETAKTLSFAWKKSAVPVNHMYGHIAANFLQPINFPALCLVISGGHTELVLLKNHHQFKKIGQTVDDAAGEAFDKVAKLLDLGYPGGPIVSAMAEKFKISNEKFKISLPRPMLYSHDFNFSFSGLKTAVLYTVKKIKNLDKDKKAEICHEFQRAVMDVLVSKTIKAAKKYKVKTVMMAGGVAANKKLRSELENAVREINLDFRVPEFKLCTDNAAMIGVATAFLARNKKIPANNWQKIKADPEWEL